MSENTTTCNFTLINLLVGSTVSVFGRDMYPYAWAYTYLGHPRPFALPPLDCSSCSWLLVARPASRAPTTTPHAKQLPRAELGGSHSCPLRAPSYAPRVSDRILIMAVHGAVETCMQCGDI